MLKRVKPLFMYGEDFITPAAYVIPIREVVELWAPNTQNTTAGFIHKAVEVGILKP